MLKALYDFQAVYPKTISFDEGEYFILYQTSARQRNWWQVVSMKGNIGFVPSNYVMKIKVEPDFLISFLNSSIESLEKSEDSEINGVMSKDELLVRLREKKNALERIYLDNTEHDIDSSLSFSQSLSEHQHSKSRLSLMYGGGHQQPTIDHELPAEFGEEEPSKSTRERNAASSRMQQQTSSTGQRSSGHHKRLLDSSKKSVSSPSMGGAMTPAIVQESSSMSSIQVQSQQSQQSQQTQHQQMTSSTSSASASASASATVSNQQTNKANLNDMAQDNSIASEPSTTTTTTSEDVVTTYREPSLKELSTTASNYTLPDNMPESNGFNEEDEHSDVDECHTNEKNYAKKMNANHYFVHSSSQNVEEDDKYSVVGGDDSEEGENSEAVSSCHSRPYDSTTRQTDGQKPCNGADSMNPDALRSKEHHLSNHYVHTGKEDVMGYVWPNRKVESSDVYQIVDAIRRNTNVSFNVSCEALRVVLTSMEQLYNGSINPYLEAIAVHVTEKVETPKELLGMTHDAKRLQYIFAQLADCKNDTQQRSWMVYEDEEDIIQFLEELVEILNNADEKISCHEMSSDQYQAMVNLVQYYQMETRWPIKYLLLQAFTAACHLDSVIVDILVTSVLPLEIVEDIKVQFGTMERLKELVKMLTIILSLGQPMPVNHQDYLGTQFAKFLLETIETSNSESFIDLLITLLLAFNLQFMDPKENPIIESMEAVDTVKVFTEKILLLLNREDDPVKLLKHSSAIMNSVLKLFIDIFSVKRTANLFYTTDNKVLIDIVVRQLTDLCAGNPLRRYYLELCRGIMRNTNYAEHQHRKQDFMKIFTRIFCEDTECSASDQQLVRDIANEFPLLFKA